MKKTTKYLLTAIAAVLIIIGVILAVKVRGTAPDQSGLIIQNGEKTITCNWEDLNKTVFTGEIVNGKGEVSSHEYKGIELIELFNANGIEIKKDTKITVASEDNYSADITGEEVMTGSKVYVAVLCDDKMIENIEGGQGGQLVVYGDANAKRQVRYLKTITIE